MKIKQKGGIGGGSAKPRPKPMPKPKSPVRAPLINIVTPEKNPRKKPNTLMPVPPKYPSLARKGGGVKKYQEAGATTTTTPAPAPKLTIASAMEANIKAGMKPRAAKRSAEKEVGVRKGVDSSNLITATGGVLGTILTSDLLKKKKLKGGITKAMYGKSVKPGMMKKGGTTKRKTTKK